MNQSKAFVGRELLELWFEFSKTEKSYINIPKLTVHIPKFVMLACTKLQLDRNIFFTTVEIIEKYLNTIPQTCNFDPTLTVVAGILISNKLIGGQVLQITNVLDFLLEHGLGEYISKSVVDKERVILKNIGFDLPLQTIYDEMNILYDLVIEPLQLVVNLRLQCADVMEFYYLYSSVIIGSLKEIYSGFSAHFNKLLINKYYVPSGVILNAVAMCNGLNIITVDELTNKISALLDIDISDLDAIYVTISETLMLVINGCEQ